MGKIVDRGESIEIWVDPGSLLEGGARAEHDIMHGGKLVIKFAWFKFHELAEKNEAVRKMWNNRFEKSEVTYDDQNHVFMVKFTKDTRPIEEVLQLPLNV